jgi:hypothetical protein
MAAHLAGGVPGFGGGCGVYHVQFYSYLATLLSFLKFQADEERHRERTQRGDFQTGSPNKYLLLFCTSSETEERPVGDGMV